LSKFRISLAIKDYKPENVHDIWELLKSIGFSPFVVFGKDDFDEILKHGGELIREDYAQFYPDALLESPAVSSHVKSLLREIIYS